MNEMFCEVAKIILDRNGNCRKIGCQNCPLDKDKNGCSYKNDIEIKKAIIKWIAENKERCEE